MGGNSLDVVNYGTGNLNSYLDYGTAGVGTGNFNWIYGQDPSNPLMSLSYEGNLGIGVTVPTNTLHVVGTSTITGNAFFGQNINVSGNTNISGNLNLLGAGSLNANLTGNVSGNVNSTVGISTFNNISVANDSSSFRSFIGIGTTGSNPSYHFQVLDSFFVASNGIGIGTNVQLEFADISALDARAVFKSVGIGTTEPREAGLTVIGNAVLSGITSTNSLFIDATQVLSSARQLQNIASLDATTTATIESAIQLAPNDFNSLNISGLSTFAGITTVTGPTLFTNQLSVSGITTFAGAIDANGDLDVDGDTELDNVNISGTLNVVGVSTFAGITTVTGTTLFAKQLNVSGVVTATTFIGALTGTATTTTNIPNLTGDVTSTGNATSIAAGVIVDADISSSAAISLKVISSKFLISYTSSL